MSDYPMSPVALARFAAAVKKLASQHDGGRMTDEELHGEIVHEIVRCDHTSELHYRLMHMDETRERVIAELAGLTVEQLNEVGGLPKEGAPAPMYVHDCEGGCKFLGHVTSPQSGRKFDAYMHTRDHVTEYIARGSSKGSDYLCVTDFGTGTGYEDTPELLASPLGQVITLARTTTNA